jgi:hypothetical protein
MARRPKADNVLVVRTFAYPTVAAGNGPDDRDARPLAGCVISLSHGPTARPDQTTGSDGEARFEDLETGDYRVAVRPPPGYRGPQANQRWLNGRRRQAIGIPVPAGGQVVVDLFLTPEAGRVTVNVQITPPAGVNLAAGDTDGIRVEARSGGLLLVAEDTARGGEAVLDIDRPGLIEIRPAGEIARGGRNYTPRAGDASQFVQVAPGDTGMTADVEYQPAQAQIVVGAQLVQEVDGQKERQPLDGVTFELFQLGAHQPLRRLTTQPAVGSVFADLPPGPYRIVATPPLGTNGQRLQLTHPTVPELSLRLGDGQQIDLTEEFQFEPSRGSIIGSVVVARDDRPVPGVAVLLIDQHEPSRLQRQVTGPDGSYAFLDLPSGTYRLVLEQPVVHAYGTRWEQEVDSADGRTIEVEPRATIRAPEFGLVEEEHLIDGQVLGPDGRGAAFVPVQLLDRPGPQGNVLDTVVTDHDGFYQFRTAAPGTFYLRVDELNGLAQQLTPVTVNRPVRAPNLFTATRQPGAAGQPAVVGPPPGVAGGPPGTVAFQVGAQELNDFPFLTEEVDLGGYGGRSQPAGGSGAVGQTVERTIRDVLGWRPRAGDTKGFLAALQHAFTGKEVAGHTEYTLNPRSYAVEIQADLGTVTGAQASIYARAKAALDQVLPLLEGLEPLRVDFDPENVNAIRAIVRSHLTELVAELGVEGGPRVQRVDQLFEFLLGGTIFERLVVTRDTEQVLVDTPPPVLAVLAQRLGLERNRINTIEEEQNFTNFLIVVDHVVSLAVSWDAQRGFFDRVGDDEPFLGTQLVLLSRDLEVIAESVHEVEYAMDSVFLGPAERQTLELQFPDSLTSPDGETRSPVAGTAPLFIAELLDWVERFATEEGRQLIDEGGRQGVVAFRPTLERLEQLVRAALVDIDGPTGQDPDRMPAAYRKQRVQRALRELADQLNSAVARVAQINPPEEDG